MARFTPQEKLAIIREAKEQKLSVFSICRKYNISKVTFYKWLALYKNAKKNRELSFTSKVRRGKFHPKGLTSAQRFGVLRLVHANPEFSCHKIAATLGLGNHGVQNFLKKAGLNLYDERLAFSKRPFWKREGAERREAMIGLLKNGWKVLEICKHFDISKQTFLKWRRRYEESGASEPEQALGDRFVKGEKHHKFLGQERERQILDFVTKNPAMSVHKIAKNFSGIVGHHGIQNVLMRHHLGTYEQRLAFSRLSEEAWKPNINLAGLPYIPLRIWRMLFAPFATIPKLAWLFTRGQIFLLFIFLLSFYFYKLIAAIATSPTGNSVGTFFASISLTFGLFFFIYSMKYYISTLMVLKLAQSGGGRSPNPKSPPDGQAGEIRNSNLGSRILTRAVEFSKKLGIKFPAFDYSSRVNPLLINLEKVELKAGERPFVSIHAAIYNERRVVERLIRACEGQEWGEDAGPVSRFPPVSAPQPFSSEIDNPNLDSKSQKGWVRADGSPSSAATRNRANYEVIIADDSTDETTAMAKEILSSGGRILDRILNNSEMEIYVSSPPVGSSQPVIKLIHRFSRAGFKGGALQKALENTNPKAQYITIFDADFVPYPDTLTQFVKTFQVLSTKDERLKTKANTNEALDISPSALDNPIAAVQGYQWHVLNKGANWVTRGVRTEYAGSYVIERASEEIYGGLKQIAGSVFCIRADVLRKFGWGKSITEDFELTLKMYEAGYKVAFTPYIQGPAEAVSTIKSLIRQRMRWAEGASFNVKLMFKRMLKSPNLSRAEKLEFVYLAPYYLQAAFFIIGTLSWFLAEAVFGSRLPFWTVAFGWSLVFTNLLALPLMNIIGLFLEESDERDYIGVLSFIALSYIVVPFQAYAAIKGFLEHEEGPWFRTPKTGLITDTLGRSGFSKFFGNVFGKPAGVPKASLQMSFSSNREADSGQARMTGQSQEDSREGSFSLARHFAFASAYNSLQGNNFVIRPRHVRYIGNLALGVIIAITVLMSTLAPFIPQAKLDVSANERQFATFSDSVKADDPVSLRENYQAEDGEIAQPFVVRYQGPDDKTLEYIFHPEPRVRTKFDGREIELKVVSSDGLGKVLVKDSLRVDGNYLYEEIFDGVDLKYSVENGGSSLVENFILKEYKNFETIDYELKTVDLEVAYRDGEIYFASRNGGNPLFTFTRPYLYEGKNPGNKNFGVELVLSKDVFGWKLQKRLTEEGRDWLRDPARSFPVVIDPTQTTSTIQTAIATDESDYGQQQRKIVWANGALNGDAWYAVYEDAGGIFYEKCVPSVDGCETGTDWTDRTDIGESGGTADTDNRNPSAWWESDRAKMWVVWADNSRDNLQFVDIDVDASDPGTAGTLCSGADQANHNPTTWQVTITLDSSDTIYVSYVDTSTSTVNNMYRIATGGCTFTDILTSSGVDASDRPILLATGTQTLHAIFQDGTTLRHSVYVNDASPGWDSADTDITGAAADNTTLNYSAATDGTDIWLIADQGTSGVDLWTCAACAASSSWTDASDPWSSQGTDITEISLAYDSTTDDMVAIALRGSGATEEAIYKVTDTTSISWGAEFGLGVFGGGASGIEDLSATMSVNDIDKVGLVVEDATNSELEFSTLPERTLYLLLAAPFLYRRFKKARERKYVFKC